MTVNNMNFLINILGEEEAKKYLYADERKLNILIDTLRFTKLDKILDKKVFNEFCEKLVFGKYGESFAKILTTISNELEKEIYIMLIHNFIKLGYNVEDEYLKIFNNENLALLELDYDMIRNLVLLEIENVTSSKITVLEYLSNGGSLLELLNILGINGINNFDMNTKINFNHFEALQVLPEYTVNLLEISLLISNLSTLDVSKKTVEELLETYYEGLEKSKEEDFSGNLTIKGKINLYKYLVENDMIESYHSEISVKDKDKVRYK